MRILKLLKPGDTVSGQKLAEALGVTRAAVNKQVNSLRKDGYVIDAVTNSGYRLISAPDIVSVEEVEARLGDRKDDFKVFCFKQTNSTQKVAKTAAEAGSAGWEVFVAETQGSGRGRMGREWLSPPGGLWFSVLLKPDIEPDKAPQITLAASLALCEAIEASTGLKTSIKWPNDVFINGRKSAGILTEMSAEVGKTHWVVAGIGVNVNNKIPAALADTATSISAETSKPADRPLLLAGFLIRFKERCDELTRNGFSAISDEYNRRSCLNGKEISVETGNNILTGAVEGIDRTGSLVLRTSKGKETVVAGDVTIMK